ncbi:MAG TPA: hypothetical protein VI636_22540 [Candidatus Angelobacter sp.]
MKFRTVVSLMLTGVLLSALALAQNQPTPEKSDSLSLMKIAADVAGNVQPQSLEGFTGIYVDAQNWAAGAKDGDLGPFLKLKDVPAKAGRSAAFFFSAAKDAAICVYFDGKSPFGVVAVKAGSGGAIKADDISAAYKRVSKDMLKKGSQEYHFAEGGITTDDGAALPGFQVTK